LRVALLEEKTKTQFPILCAQIEENTSTLTIQFVWKYKKAQKIEKYKNTKLLILPGMLMLKPEEAESKESFKNTQIRAGEDIENEMAAEKNPRKRGEHRPEPNHKDNPIEKLSLIGEVSESGDEEDARGVAAGEGEMVDGNGGVHVLVVERAGSAEEELDEGDENEVEEEAEEEGGDEGAAEEGGGGGIGGEEEGEGDWEEEAEIGGEFEEEEEEVWEERFGFVVEVLREGCV
jgi:hypothetical protein